MFSDIIQPNLSNQSSTANLANQKAPKSTPNISGSQNDLSILDIAKERSAFSNEFDALLVSNSPINDLIREYQEALLKNNQSELDTIHEQLKEALAKKDQDPLYTFNSFQRDMFSVIQVLSFKSNIELSIQNRKSQTGLTDTNDEQSESSQVTFSATVNVQIEVIKLKEITSFLGTEASSLTAALDRILAKYDKNAQLSNTMLTDIETEIEEAEEAEEIDEDNEDDEDDESSNKNVLGFSADDITGSNPFASMLG
jgi:hypothetical protein